MDFHGFGWISIDFVRGIGRIFDDFLWNWWNFHTSRKVFAEYPMGGCIVSIERGPYRRRHRSRGNV